MNNTWKLTEDEPLTCVGTDTASVSLVPTELLRTLMEEAGYNPEPLLEEGDVVPFELTGYSGGYVFHAKSDGVSRIWNAEDKDGNKAFVLTLPYHDLKWE